MEKRYRISQLALIFAKDLNNVLGKNNTIPWKSPHDFRWFRDLTIGHSVIMGRKTWESLPTTAKPLVNRINYVITRNPDYDAEGAIVKSGLFDAVGDALQKDKDGLIFVIGGKLLLEEASNLASRAYISTIGVETPIDEACVMAPELPNGVLERVKQLFHGDDIHPSVVASVTRFVN